MTEKEKAKAGFLYDANNDPEIGEDHLKAMDLCFEANHLPPRQVEKRHDIFRKLLAETPEKFYIEPPFLCGFGYNIKIGNNFYANHNCVILDNASVSFGDNVFIAPDCGFYTAGHPFDIEQRNSGLEYAFPIQIGNNVWIGGHTVVLPGVTIGDGTVIGAGSVVTKNIPSGVLAAGNPCRVIRKLTPADKDKYRLPE